MSDLLRSYEGKTIGGGRFRLERLLGQGGMGAVYEGVQIDLDRAVAIKLLLDVDERARARFRQEATAASRIDHPNVVKTIDLVVTDGEPPAIVMELVRGETLAGVIARDGPLPPSRAIAIAREMLAALDAAHGLGIVHRDVKPRNVLISAATGAVKVVDFGLVKLLDDAQPGIRTTTGTILGTPAYMAPEQLAHRAIDARTDVHAVGLCLYEMVTKARPFRGKDNVDLFEQVLSFVPPPASSVEKGVSRELSDVIAKAMRKAPAERFASAAAMKTALEAVGQAPVRARRTFLVAGGSVIVIGGVGLAAAAAVWRGREPASASASAATSASASASASASTSASASASASTSASTSASASASASAFAQSSPPPLRASGVTPGSASSTPVVKVSASFDLFPPDAAAATGPVRPVCACTIRHSNGLRTRLCITKMTPRCTCEWNGFLLCTAAMGDDFACASTDYGGPGRESGDACEGWNAEVGKDGLRRGGVKKVGALRCSYCYGRDVQTQAAVENARCGGWNTDQFFQGTWQCD